MVYNPTISFIYTVIGVFSVIGYLLNSYKLFLEIGIRYSYIALGAILNYTLIECFRYLISCVLDAYKGVY